MLRWFLFGWVVFNITSVLIVAFGDLEPPSNSSKLPPCKACKTFVESFKKGLERTSKFKFEGGDTAWEEEKLGSYATSEIRFVEIQEKLCSEVRDGKESCYNLLEEYDETLEDWWFNKQTEEPDLYKYLCIDSFKVCCKDLHFGKDCLPCPGYPDNICHKNGRCKGAGTRKGDGKCFCDKGYAGHYCDKCDKSFYVSYKDDRKILCSECHLSCDGSCTKAGPTGCEKCKSGWLMDKEKGCLDVNECAASKSPCTPLQFCVNKEGGYRCLDCDKACAGCSGDGPDMCVHCASGYYKKDNMCTDASEEYRKSYVVIARYLTYLGLCVTTCIILHKNTYLAAIIGFCVAVYITVSEYMLNSVPKSRDVENQVAEQVLKAFN
ncbi:cysteine-rich with EGF-like domain protein 2 [Anoplophora glabripennis]|uniref:Cysteine-rich with EGF-like domain protein n=1 Tax=Anoplophora glabripennis TaxID=217634 RepID=V5H1Q1_ANOGL|nr:cysteine-rich with EGF-like domain protein 2 [Anoplophora glabripennis]